MAVIRISMALKNVFVIMIMPFDPFGYNHMIYTIKNGCVEIPDMPYEDGARTLYLYTKGEYGNSAKELRELLEFMEDTRHENAKNDTLKEIQQMVDSVKQETEVSLDYMRMMRRESDIAREAERRGIRIGERRQLMDLVKKKLDRGMTAEEIADMLETEISIIEEIIVEMK